MAELTTVARPYARAAFEHARDGKTLGSWSAFLESAAAIVRDEQMASMLDNPELSDDRLVALLLGVVTAAGVAVDEQQQNFLKLLAANHRLGLLPEIVQAFAMLRAEAERTIEIEVTSAMALTDEQRRRLAEALTERFKRKVELKERVDPELIGGAVVRAGDLVIDGSVKSRVEQLTTRMAAD